MINKELVLTVLDYPHGIFNFGIVENELLVLSKRACHDDAYNLNEFASKCKETMLNYGNGYCIMSFIDFDGTWFANVSGSEFKKGFQATSEAEVIFKACDWIIETEKEK